MTIVEALHEARLHPGFIFKDIKRGIMYRVIDNRIQEKAADGEWIFIVNMMNINSEFVQVREWYKPGDRFQVSYNTTIYTIMLVFIENKKYAILVDDCFYHQGTAIGLNLLKEGESVNFSRPDIDAMFNSQDWELIS